jgi:hypothetical protein
MLAINNILNYKVFCKVAVLPLLFGNDINAFTIIIR